MASHQNIHVVRIDLLILGNLYGSEVPSENIWPNEEIHIIKSMTKGRANPTSGDFSQG